MNNGRIKARLQAIRSSYWLVPTVMALAALLLGAGMIWLDAWLGTSWIKGISWYQQIGVDGAREVLSTIAGSMITVAGVVFSITILALSYASSQYGPRVLTNFMSDRGNTITLGTFIATFVYCLMVLRTIHGGDQSFVPQLSVVGALLLALGSIAVLIYFIHHVPETIHINNVVARIGEQLIRHMKKRFPAVIGEPAPHEGRRAAVELDGPLAQISAADTGYIQSIDERELLRTAARADVIVRLNVRTGDFVSCGRTLAMISPGSRCDEQLSAELQGCFAVGSKRTPDADLMFLVSELVEIAARALSPGVNDPMTAITCLDWLGAGATEFAIRKPRPATRLDEEGKPRLIADADDFEYFVASSFGRVRDYAARDTIAALHLLRVIRDVAAMCRLPEQLEVLRGEASRFSEAAATELRGPGARAVREKADELELSLTQGVGRIDKNNAERLGGSASAR